MNSPSYILEFAIILSSRNTLTVAEDVVDASTAMQSSWLMLITYGMLIFTFVTVKVKDLLNGR